MDRHGMVQMKAKTFGTTNSPTSGQVLHVDSRSQADVNARYPYVSPADAEHLKGLGWAEEYDGRVPSADGADETIGEFAARNVEEHNDGEESVDPTTGLSTRSTTAFERAPHELAGAGGGGRTMVLGDIGGAGPGSDEAPAGGGRPRGNGNGNGNGEGGEGGPKPLSHMSKTELEKTAADEKVDIAAAKNNEERASLIQKARDAAAK